METVYTGNVIKITSDGSGKAESFQIGTKDLSDIAENYVIANRKYANDKDNVFSSVEVGKTVSFTLNSNKTNYVKALFVVKGSIQAESGTELDVKSEYLNMLNLAKKPFISIEKFFNEMSENPSPTTEARKVTSHAFGKSGRLALPDLLECVLGIGTIAVDVRYRTLQLWTVEKVPAITISKDSYKRALQFHREFCLPWWWVVKVKNPELGDLSNNHFLRLSLFDFDRWYEYVLEKERAGESTGFIIQENETPFIAIPLENWSEISLLF